MLTFVLWYQQNNISNKQLKKIGPRLWIPLVMLAWGGVMISMAAIKNEKGLYAGRFFLGLAESVIFRLLSL